MLKYARNVQHKRKTGCYPQPVLRFLFVYGGIA